MPALPEQHLQQDLAAVTQPDINTPFNGTQDVFARLAPYHLLHSSNAREGSASNEASSQAVEAAEEALENFHKRLKKEGAVDHMRLVSEQAFLEGLWAQQEQVAKQGVVQSALAAAATQARQPTAPPMATHAAAVRPPTAVAASQPLPSSSLPSTGASVPAGGSLANLAENQSGWVQINNLVQTGATQQLNAHSAPNTAHLQKLG